MQVTLSSACTQPAVVPAAAAKGCFSSQSTVRTMSGGVVPYSSVKIGDQVLSMSTDGVAFFDKVFRITHHRYGNPPAFLVDSPVIFSPAISKQLPDGCHVNLPAQLTSLSSSR